MAAQSQIKNTCVVPYKLDSDQPELIYNMGFEVIHACGPRNECIVVMPEGWYVAYATKTTYEIYDDRSCKRIACHFIRSGDRFEVFYMNIFTRFVVEHVMDRSGIKVMSYHVRDLMTRKIPFLNFRGESPDKAMINCARWLSTNYPEWGDPLAYRE